MQRGHLQESPFHARRRGKNEVFLLQVDLAWPWPRLVLKRNLTDAICGLGSALGWMLRPSHESPLDNVKNVYICSAHFNSGIHSYYPPPPHHKRPPTSHMPVFHTTIHPLPYHYPDTLYLLLTTPWPHASVSLSRLSYRSDIYRYKSINTRGYSCVTLFSFILFDTHPPPRNANNIV